MHLFQKRGGTCTVRQDGEQVSPPELAALKLNIKLRGKGKAGYCRGHETVACHGGPVKKPQTAERTQAATGPSEESHPELR